MLKRKGQLFVVSAPSGAGKTTLCNMFAKEFDRIKYSVSYTTREPRDGEQNGVHYHFITKDEFKAMIDKMEFLEFAEVYGNYYGTAKKTVDSLLSQNCDVLLEIDPQGAMKVKELFPSAVYIYIVPPSLEVLKTRLIARNDNTKSVELRLEKAVEEMAYIKYYDYVIVNDTIVDAYKTLTSVYEAEGCNTALVEIKF